MSRITQRISNLIKDQLPEFLKVDHEVLVAFLEAYYKFLEQDQQAFELIQNSLSYNDIDSTVPSFADYFLNTYAKNVPVGSLLDRSILIKRIKDLFESKGSQISFETLFRIFYNSAVQYKHPYDYVLRPSDGNWSQRISIHVEETEGDGSNLENKFLTLFKNGFLYKTSIETVKILTENRYEIFLQSKTYIPPYEVGDQVYSSNSTQLFFIGNIIPTISNYEILQGGTGFRKGQILNLVDQNGTDSIARVINVSNVGAVSQLAFVSYGYGYDSNLRLGFNKDRITPTPADSNLYASFWSWGKGEEYNNGSGSLVDKYLPSTDPKGTGNNIEIIWKDIGQGGTAAIKTDGTLWTWGNTQFGQALTNNSIPRISTPTQVTAFGNNWSTLITSSDTNVIGGGIKTDGTLWMWGVNGTGYRHGTGDTTSFRSSPIQTAVGGNNWKQVAAGTYHSGAVKTNGTLWTWGNGNFGGLGQGDTLARSTPTQVGTNNTWKNISFGAGHALATKTDGTLWSWGWNVFGALGDGTSTNKSSPIQVGSSTNWKQAAASSFISLAVKEDGSLWGWGGNSGGSGHSTTQYTPKQIANTSSNTWSSIYAGFSTSFGIKTDGTLWSWGKNGNGALGLGITVSETIAPAQVILTSDSYYANTKWEKIAAGGGSSTEGPSVVALRTEEYPLTDAVIDFTQGAVGRYPGQFTTNKGFISEPDVRLQDSELYQPFAYQLTSDLDITVFYDVVKKLIHPAGTNLFSNRVIELSANLLGNISVITSSNTDITFDSASAPTFASIIDSLSFVLTKPDLRSNSLISDNAAIALAKAPILESFSATDSANITTTKVLSDSLTSYDDIKSFSITTNLTDTSGISDSLSLNVTTRLSDTLGVTDSLQVGYLTSLSDSLLTTDNLTKSIQKIYEDTTLATDNIQFTINTTLLETTAVSDQTTLNVITRLSDTLGVTDSLQVGYLTSLSDSLLTTDNLTKSIQLIYADAALVTDNISLSFNTTLLETTAVSDQTTLNVNINIIDSTNVTDLTYVSLSNQYSQDPSYFADIYAE